MSQETGIAKRSAASRSTSRTCALVRLGRLTGGQTVGRRALDEERAVGVPAVDRCLLRDLDLQQLDQQARREGAHLRVLERRVPEGTVVDRDADAVLGLLLLGERSLAADGLDHLGQLLLEAQPGQLLLDHAGMASGDA